MRGRADEGNNCPVASVVGCVCADYFFIKRKREKRRPGTTSSLDKRALVAKARQRQRTEYEYEWRKNIDELPNADIRDMRAAG